MVGNQQVAGRFSEGGAPLRLGQHEGGAHAGAMRGAADQSCKKKTGGQAVMGAQGMGTFRKQKFTPSGCLRFVYPGGALRALINVKEGNLSGFSAVFSENSAILINIKAVPRDYAHKRENEVKHDTGFGTERPWLEAFQETRKASFLDVDRLPDDQRHADDGFYLDSPYLCVGTLAMKRHDEILRKYNFQVPRYTSYPPATQFKDEGSADRHVAWLSGVSGDISLYIHIPFCARLCHYCGCNMRVVNHYEPVIEYLDVLKEEIRRVRSYLAPGVRVTHLHFGGGSPTILKAGDFSRLVLFLNEIFPFAPGLEISVEADPRNLTEAKISAYAQSGVTRLSLGVQDFNEEVLALINRPQPFHVTYRALQLCRAYGIHHINFDLMYGLPGQTQETILRTLELAVSLKPSRISYFGYAHVPWMKKHMKLMPEDRLPGGGERASLQEVGANFIEAAGYLPVGIDHFALPEDTMSMALREGTLHRNFQGYTTDTAQTLIGLGASSISAFREGYVQNNADLRQYMLSVRDGVLPSRKCLPFDRDDRPVADIIERVMCYLTVNLADIRRKHGLRPGYFDYARQRLAELELDGVVVLRGDVVTLSPEYRVLARVVCDAFDAYTVRGSDIRKHAQAV